MKHFDLINKSLSNRKKSSRISTTDTRKVLFLLCSLLFISVLITFIIGIKVQSHLSIQSSKVFVRSENYDQLNSVYSSNDDQINIKTAHNRFLYIVRSENGLNVYENKNLSSNVISYLPVSSIVVGDAIINDDSAFSMALYVSFPYKGWLLNDSKMYYKKSIYMALSVSRDKDQKCVESNFFENTDIKGNDLSETPLVVSSVVSCCHECLSSQDCNLFTFTPDGNCWLKSSEQSTSEVASSINNAAGLKSGIISKTFVSENSTDDASLIAQLKSKQSLAICCGSSNTDDIKSSNIVLNKLDYFNLGISGDEEYNNNPWVIRLNKSPNDCQWNEQFPIGNGKFGGLVGGTTESEIIPISISGLYTRSVKSSLPNNEISEQIQQIDSVLQLIGNHPQVMQTSENLQKQKLELLQRQKKLEIANKKKLENSTNQVSDEPSVKYEAFIAARQALQQGQIQEGNQIIAGMRDEKSQPNYGMFEYISDLTFLFSSSKIYSNDYNSVNSVKSKLPQKNRIRAGRNGLIDYMKYQLTLSSEPTHASISSSNKKSTSKKSQNTDNGLKNTILLSNSLLDMKNGVVSTFIVEALTNDTKKENVDKEIDSVRLHFREWFVSEVDDVMVGYMSSKAAKLFSLTSKVSHDGRLDSINNDVFSFALRISRDINKNTPFMKLDLNLRHLDKDNLARYKEYREDKRFNAIDNNQIIYQFDYTMKPTEALEMPDVYMCGVVVCEYPLKSNEIRPDNKEYTDTIFDGKSSENSNIEKKSRRRKIDSGIKKADTMICNDISSLTVYVSSVIMEDIDYDPYSENPGYTKGKQNQDSSYYQSKCQSKVLNALHVGRKVLKSRHSKLFSSRMSRLDLEMSSFVNSTNNQGTCTFSSIDKRLKSFNSGCLAVNTTQSTVTQGDKSYLTTSISNSIQSPETNKISRNANEKGIDLFIYLHSVLTFFQWKCFLLES